MRKQENHRRAKYRPRTGACVNKAEDTFALFFIVVLGNETPEYGDMKQREHAAPNVENFPQGRHLDHLALKGGVDAQKRSRKKDKDTGNKNA